MMTLSIDKITEVLNYSTAAVPKWWVNTHHWEPELGHSPLRGDNGARSNCGTAGSQGLFTLPGRAAGLHYILGGLHPTSDGFPDAQNNCVGGLECTLGFHAKTRSGL